MDFIETASSCGAIKSETPRNIYRAQRNTEDKRKAQTRGLDRQLLTQKASLAFLLSQVTLRPIFLLVCTVECLEYLLFVATKDRDRLFRNKHQSQLENLLD